MGRRHWSDSFSRNGSGSSRQDEVGRTIFKRVEALFDNRWMLLCPFDVVKDPVREIWKYALTPLERGAWNVLVKNKHFNKAINRQTYFDINHSVAGFRIRVYTNTEIPAWPVWWGNIPPELAERLSHWQIQSRAYRDEFYAIRDKVKSLVKMCSTPGQIERVWPALMGFMPDKAIDRQIEKKARSPYPDGVLAKDAVYGGLLSGEVRDEWKPEVLAWFDHAIAEALILPEYKHPEGAPAYPEISDL